jgi:hypothetical protein
MVARFPMSMFFEPGMVDSYRKSLAQQTNWSALKGTFKFPPVDQSPSSSSSADINDMFRSNSSGQSSTLFRTRKVPDKRSVSVQTEGPLGSSDVRYSRPNSRPIRSRNSRNGVHKEVDIMDDILPDNDGLNVTGAKVSPDKSAQTSQRKGSSGKKKSSRTSPTTSVDLENSNSLDYNLNDGSSIVSMLSSMEDPSNHSYSYVHDHDDNASAVSAMSMPHMMDSSRHGNDNGNNLDSSDDCDPTDGAASETSKASNHSTASGTMASLLSSQSTTYGYMFPKGGVDPSRVAGGGSLSGADAGADAKGGKGRQPFGRKMKVKYMKQAYAPSANTFIAQQRQYIDAIPPANAAATQNRMGELEAWRESRLSNDKKKRIQAVSAVENALTSDLSMSIYSIGSSKTNKQMQLSPIMKQPGPKQPTPPTTISPVKKMPRNSSGASIRSLSSNSSARGSANDGSFISSKGSSKTDNLLNATEAGASSRGRFNADDASVSSNLTLGTFT